MSYLVVHAGEPLAELLNGGTALKVGEQRIDRYTAVPEPPSTAHIPLVDTEALEKVVLASFTTARPPKPKPNRPPSAAAPAIAADIGGGVTQRGEPVIDLGVYQRHIGQQNRGRR